MVTVSRARRAGTIACATFAYTCILHASEPGPPDTGLAAGVDRAGLVRAAVERSPAVRAAKGRARASAREGDAVSRLPPPTAMVQVWQVPLAKPYAVGDAQMAMIGLEQEFPAPGARGEREAAKAELAREGDAMASDRARMVARDAEHAFADYVEVTTRRKVHLAHRDIDARMLRVAEARQAAGGSLVEVARIEAELELSHADVGTDEAREDAARARINALLGRDPAAPLGPPQESAPEVPAWDTATLLAKARASRPEIQGARAARDAEARELAATEREAAWPSFKIAGLYFAPVGPAPAHGYGVNASMTLPWLWGAAAARRDVEREKLEAAGSEVDAQRLAVDVDISTAAATTRSAARRLDLLASRARPAAVRAFDVAWNGYESGRTDLTSALLAERGVVDIDLEVVMARATLDHALADLDAAAGAPVPRVPLAAASSTSGGGDHGH
jgi:outer membrane protein, heavy metal efflux system